MSQKKHSLLNHGKTRQPLKSKYNTEINLRNMTEIKMWCIHIYANGFKSYQRPHFIYQNIECHNISFLYGVDENLHILSAKNSSTQ